MKIWFSALAACAVLTELAEALAPKGWNVHIRRIAALAAMAVLLAPLRDLPGVSRDLAGDFGSLLHAAEPGEPEAEGDAWFCAAELVFRTAEELGIDPGSLAVAFREEDGALKTIEVTAPRCPWNLRAALESELEAYFGADTEVLTGDGEGRSG